MISAVSASNVETAVTLPGGIFISVKTKRGEIMAKTREEKADMMLNGDIRKTIISMAVPTITAQLITVFYNLVDTYFVSTIGTNATAAVGVNSSLERSISMIGTFIGSGAASYLARSLGRRDQEAADRVLSTSLVIGMGLGLIMLALGIPNIRSLVYFLGANDDCAVYAMQYAQYVLLAAPFMVGSFIFNMCLKSEGSASIAMIGIGFGGILNCFLDPIFIRTLGLGVAGASIATAISKTISFAILAYMYIAHKSAVNISLKKFRIVKEEALDVIRIGSASLLRTLCMIYGNITINRIASSYSTSALAAMSVSNRVMEFPFAIILGFGMGYQPTAGFNWGAKRYDRVREGLDFATMVSIVGGIIMGAVIILFRRPLISVFNRQADPEVLRICTLCIVLQCIALPAHTFLSIHNMFYSGIGKAKAALALSTARQGYLLIPLLYILPALMGVNGLASAQCGADVLSLLITVPLAIHARKLIGAEMNA